MTLIHSKCIEFNEKRKICIAEENGKKYQLNNASNFTVKKVKVDKCLEVSRGGKRCDYLMYTRELKKVFFIELKGGNLNKAVNQIYSTILYLKSEFADYRINARIVNSKDVPQFKNTPDYRRLAREVLPTKGTIERGTNIYIESI